MKIGITEYGDAGIDLRWKNRLTDMDGAILITKNITNAFTQAVFDVAKNTPIILHATCTGWGGTVMEPNVPDYKTQLENTKHLIDICPDLCDVVLRVDPVFPTQKGVDRVLHMLDYFQSLKTGITSHRMSIVDEYPHVRERYRAKGFEPMYGGRFSPNDDQIELVGKALAKTGMRFATCAEDKLAEWFPETFYIQGCVSHEDIYKMGLDYEADMAVNPQKRNGCHCLSCKTELLNRPRQKCPHNCLYCFWKD